MPDYSELEPRELDELVSIGLLNIISLLIDADIENNMFQHHLDMVNAAVAELAIRAEYAKSETH